MSKSGRAGELISIKVARLFMGQSATMRPDLIERYGGPVPRYTSYPTAPHFQDDVDGDVYAAWLAELPHTDPISVYLHVPFCKEMCWYCGCHTKVVRRAAPLQDYAATLLKEIDLVGDVVSHTPVVSHLHWGGGTPTILKPSDFLTIMDRLRDSFRFADDAELAIEVDPRTLDEDRAKALGAAGINRVSLGIQDFDPAVQQAINRVQTFDQTRHVADMLRSVGIEALNVDLMYGLPHQGTKEVLATVDKALELRPDRISLFGYAHVPWMKTHQKLINDADLADGPVRWACAEAAAARLSEAGYRRIGFDHFARRDDALTRALDSGDLRRNFQGYTNDQADTLIGFGASAIGNLPQGYVQNAPSVRAWRRSIEAGRLPIAKGRAVSREDQRRRQIINKLICDMEVDLAEHANGDGLPSEAFHAERARLTPMIDDGLVRLEGRKVCITDQGRPFVRNVCAVFDQYLGAGAARHSRAV